MQGNQALTQEQKSVKNIQHKLLDRMLLDQETDNIGRDGW